MKKLSLLFKEPLAMIQKVVSRLRFGNIEFEYAYTEDSVKRVSTYELFVNGVELELCTKEESRQAFSSVLNDISSKHAPDNDLKKWINQTATEIYCGPAVAQITGPQVQIENPHEFLVSLIDNFDPADQSHRWWFYELIQEVLNNGEPGIDHEVIQNDWDG